MGNGVDNIRRFYNLFNLVATATQHSMCISGYSQIAKRWTSLRLNTLGKDIVHNTFNSNQGLITPVIKAYYALHRVMLEA